MSIRNDAVITKVRKRQEAGIASYCSLLLTSKARYSLATRTPDLLKQASFSLSIQFPPLIVPPSAASQFCASLARCSVASSLDSCWRSSDQFCKFPAK